MIKYTSKFLVKFIFKEKKLMFKLKLLIWLQTDVKLFKLSYLYERKLAGTIYYHFTDEQYIYVISEDGIISNQFPVRN